MFELLFFELSLLFAEMTFAVFLLKLLVIAIIIFAIIGVISTIRFILRHRKGRETPGQYWMRTGRMKK